MAEAQPGRESRPIRWLRVLTGVPVAVAGAGASAVTVLALRTLERPTALVVVALAAVPVVAAWVVRRRLLWLATALPALRTELRRLADEPVGSHAADRADDPVADPQDRAVDRAEAAAAADELDRRLRDRVTLRGLWRAVRWLRSPAAQAGTTAQQRLGPRASATVATTTGAAERLVGLLLLASIAGWGTAASFVGALVLALVAADPGAPS